MKTIGRHLIAEFHGCGQDALEWGAPLVAAMHEELGCAFRHTAGHLCFLPSYPSGCWHLAWAADDRPPHEHFDRARTDRS